LGSTADNKRIARIWFDRVMNQRDPSAIDEYYAEDYVHRGPDGHELGRDEAHIVANRLNTISTDRHAEPIQQVAEGEVVTTRWESRGTYAIDIEGGPSAGDPFHIQGIVLTRVVDGLIVEDWEIIDYGSKS